jgi:hypothetical protein
MTCVTAHPEKEAPNEFPETIPVCSIPARFTYCSSNGALGSRCNAHQELAEILAAQETDEGPRRVLKSLYHVFAIFDSSLADPAATSRMKSP